MSARTFRGTSHNLNFLARRLRASELVAVPTETVYGLAGNALDARACAEIFRVKGRPKTDPLIVHIHSMSQLELVCIPNASAQKLAAKCWPGPLTLVLPKKPAIPDAVTAGKSSVAVRMPAHRLLKRLLRLAAVPLAAPSANPFGYVSPTTAEHVKEGLGNRVKYILDGGATSVGLESTILDLRDERHPRLLRPGAITRSQLERILGRRVGKVKKGAPKRAAQIAPGMLTRHYSPHTPVVLHSKIRRSYSAVEAYVFFRKPKNVRGTNIYWLDGRGNDRAAARRLFSLLRQLDHAGYRRINAELAPGRGLADAINDRLRRAAAS